MSIRATTCLFAAVAVMIAGCGGASSAEPTQAQAAVCSAGRQFATDVGTDAYSWTASEDAILRAAFDQGDDPVANAGEDFVSVRRGAEGPWFEAFLRFAQACEEVGAAFHSDPRSLLCDFQTKRRAQFASVEFDVDYCE